jgi:hypothetical protein
LLANSTTNALSGAECAGKSWGWGGGLRLRRNWRGFAPPDHPENCTAMGGAALFLQTSRKMYCRGGRLCSSRPPENYTAVGGRLCFSRPPENVLPWGTALFLQTSRKLYCRGGRLCSSGPPTKIDFRGIIWSYQIYSNWTLQNGQIGDKIESGGHGAALPHYLKKMAVPLQSTLRY